MLLPASHGDGRSDVCFPIFRIFRFPLAVAHHVQKKATRAHNAYRPKKKRPSDIYRKPPSYPAMPDIPWMTKLSSGDAAAAPSQ